MVKQTQQQKGQASTQARIRHRASHNNDISEEYVQSSLPQPYWPRFAAFIPTFRDFIECIGQLAFVIIGFSNYVLTHELISSVVLIVLVWED